jgi:hypothetical protein
VTAKFLVVPSKATRNVVIAERDITATYLTFSLFMSGWTLHSRSIHPVTPIASSPSLSESVSLSMADSVPHTDFLDDPALPAAQRADHQECATPSPGEVRMDRIERTLQMVTSQLACLQLPPSVAVPVPDPVPSSSCTPTVRVRNRRYATVLSVDSYRL